MRNVSLNPLKCEYVSKEGEIFDIRQYDHMCDSWMPIPELIGLEFTSWYNACRVMRVYAKSYPTGSFKVETESGEIIQYHNIENAKP